MVSPKPPISSIHFIQKALDLGDVVYKEEWASVGEYLRLAALINTLNKEYDIQQSITDQKGLHMFMWAIDNPPPYDYEEFIEWAEAYDSEVEGVEIEFSI